MNPIYPMDPDQSDQSGHSRQSKKSGQNDQIGRAAMQIIVEFDRSLLSHFTVSEWNAFIDDLMARDLIPPTWSEGERPPPMGVMVNFRNLQRAHYRLEGINLSMCWLEGADFTEANLKHAQLGCGRNVCYRGARLDHADCGVEISGCDFTDATGLDTAKFKGAVYDPANPPIGLPPEVLAVCKAEADPPADPRQPSNPQEPTGMSESPLRACVTIQKIRWS
jgi:hypothetical protein